MALSAKASVLDSLGDGLSVQFKINALSAIDSFRYINIVADEVFTIYNVCMDKPRLLYHASPSREIKVFEPRAEQMRDRSEGPVVFATPNKASVSCFIVKTDDSWTQISTFGDVQTMIISDLERFEREDHGGAIYELPSDTFIHEIRGGASDEWTSRVPVKPIGKTEYDSGLEAMIEEGVQVYVVDKPTFQNIYNAKDNGMGILRTLTSENQKHKINVNQLPKGDFSE